MIKTYHSLAASSSRPAVSLHNSQNAVDLGRSLYDDDDVVSCRSECVSQITLSLLCCLVTAGWLSNAPSLTTNDFLKD